MKQKNIFSFYTLFFIFCIASTHLYGMNENNEPQPSNNPNFAQQFAENQATGYWKAKYTEDPDGDKYLNDIRRAHNSTLPSTTFTLANAAITGFGKSAGTEICKEGMTFIISHISKFVDPITTELALKFFGPSDALKLNIESELHNARIANRKEIIASIDSYESEISKQTGYLMQGAILNRTLNNNEKKTLALHIVQCEHKKKKLESILYNVFPEQEIKYTEFLVDTAKKYRQDSYMQSAMKFVAGTKAKEQSPFSFDSEEISMHKEDLLKEAYKEEEKRKQAEEKKLDIIRRREEKRKQEEEREQKIRLEKQKQAQKELDILKQKETELVQNLEQKKEPEKQVALTLDELKIQELLAQKNLEVAQKKEAELIDLLKKIEKQDTQAQEELDILKQKETELVQNLEQKKEREKQAALTLHEIKIQELLAQKNLELAQKK